MMLSRVKKYGKEYGKKSISAIALALLAGGVAVVLAPDPGSAESVTVNLATFGYWFMGVRFLTVVVVLFGLREQILKLARYLEKPPGPDGEDEIKSTTAYILRSMHDNHVSVFVYYALFECLLLLPKIT